MDEPTQWCPRPDHEGSNPLPATEFGRSKGPCRACERERMRRWREANPEASRERDRRYREANREKMREATRRWREANRETYLENHREAERRYRAADPEKTREYMHAYNHQYREANRERLDERNRQYREAARDAVFGHYSPASPPCCACCGTTSNLSIDHIGGDGADHREEVTGKSRSGTIWYWLIKQGFPPGFQVLCKPCNASKGRGEHCILDH